MLSHLHEDHWDRVTDRELDHRLPVLTTGPAADALHARGFGAADGLDTWEHRDLIRGDRMLPITALPGRHAPGVLQRVFPVVMGSMLEFGPRGGQPDLRVYISGDTLMYEGVTEISRRYPDIDLGIVHLGGTKPLRLVMVTMNGQQGADWLETVGCPRVIPVHFNDYTVFRSPLADFLSETKRRGLNDRVQTIERGGTLPLRSAAR